MLDTGVVSLTRRATLSIRGWGVRLLATGEEEEGGKVMGR